MCLCADWQFKEILEQSLNYAEAENYLSFTPDPSSKVTLLGLTASDIRANNPYKQVGSIIHSLVIWSLQCHVE